MNGFFIFIDNNGRLNKIDCVATFLPIPTLRTSGKRKLSTPCTYNENTPANRDSNRYFIVKILYGFYLFFKFFLLSLFILRCTFLISSLGESCSGLIPLCNNISRTAVLLSICSFSIGDCPYRSFACTFTCLSFQSLGL